MGQVRRYLDELVPAQPKPSMQPAGRTVVNLATLFSAGEAVPVTGEFFPSGLSATVTATPGRWAWQVDGQVVMQTDHPGRRYVSGRSPRTEPGFYAAHVFTERGAHQVSVTSTWTGRVVLRGVGELPVDGPVVRTSPLLTVPVVEAQAELVHSP